MNRHLAARSADSPPHILLLGPDWAITSKFRKELVRDAVAAGWRVSIVAGGPIGLGRRVFAPLGAECYEGGFDRTGFNAVSDLIALQRNYAILRRLKPDAVLAFTIKPVTLGLIAAALAGVCSRSALITGVGYALMDGDELRRRVARSIAVALYRWSLRGTHRIFFQNGDDQATFSTLGILPRGLVSTRIAGSGVDLEKFQYAPMSDGPFTFLMVARLLREKGVFEFVEAARTVRSAQAETRFILVGPFDSNPTSASPDDVRAWCEEGIVEVAGEQEDVVPYLRQAHVFVLPSYREGMPRSALEALAVGRPVLVTDVPGCRDVVLEGINGHLVQPRDARSLANGMLWFLERRGALGSFSIAARNYCEKNFDVKQVNRVILSSIASDLRAKHERD